MNKDILGLTRKELLIFALLLGSSILLIVYSSVKLIHKYYKNDRINFSEIQSQSRDLVYLNELNTYALNVQRNALNMLVYKANAKEIADFERIINKNRDSLLLNLNRIDNNDVIVQYKRNEILQAGLDYLKVNQVFLKMFNDNVETTKLSDYNLEKMRPSIRFFTDVIKHNVTLLVEKIQYTNSNRTSLLHQIEFWLLLIGLTPYLYFLYKIISIIIRMIFWSLFSDKA
jgi:hypothetical protein